MACEFPVVVKAKLMLTAIHCLHYFTYLQCCASVVCAMARCLSVCLSVRSYCSILMTEQIELVFGAEATLCLYNVGF